MYHSGIRANHSTDFCLAQLIEFVLTGLACWHDDSRSSESL